MNEAEYFVSYEELWSSRRVLSVEAVKLNSIIVLFFIQIIPSLKTKLRHAYLHRC